MAREYDSMQTYIELKRQLLATGQLSCSQVGFNTAQGKLAELLSQQQQLLKSAMLQVESWATPPLIRSDWIEHEAWQFWLGHELSTAHPAGHVLTPKPVAHLLNRLRYHPQEEMGFMLSGLAFRNVGGTLPLYRQVVFNIIETAFAGGRQAGLDHARQVFSKVAELARQQGLQVERSDGCENIEGRLLLRFSDLQPVSVCKVSMLNEELVSACGLAGQHFALCSVSLERWCLALISGEGTNPGRWRTD